MKILFAINTLEKGGAERVVSNLTSYLAKQNEVAIMMLEKQEIAYKINENVKLYYAVEEKKYSKIKILRRIKKVFVIFEQILNMRRKIKEINPEVIVSFLPDMSLRILKANNTKIPIIVSVRNDPKTEYKNWFLRKIMQKLYPKAEGFIFQTAEAKEYFSEKIVKDYAIIPNPINEEFMLPPYEGEREKTIVTVGRLSEQKNQRVLIEAFSEIAKQYDEYKLIIYGEGPLKERLQELINQYNLTQRVILAGKVDNIKEKIYKSSLFVLSSNYEGMPNALIEAMGLGLPVISTDCPCGGPRFLIQNNVNGILVNVSNKEELKDAMKKILDDREFSIKISKEANKICEKLNPTIINKQFEDYIKSIRKKDIQ